MKVILSLIVLVFVGSNLYSQDSEVKEFRRTSIKTKVGFGLNEVADTDIIGLGFVYSLGVQKTYGEKKRTRISTNLLFGVFSSISIPEIDDPYYFDPYPDQYYHTRALTLNLHYDLIKYKSVAFVTSLGMFANYSSGLMQTGGVFGTGQSGYFHNWYYGGGFSFAFRITPKKGNLVYEIKPIKIQLGNDYYTAVYFMLGVDFKLKK